MLFGLCLLAAAQTVAPPGMAAELAQPFCWYLVPSDEIGFKDSPMAFQLTYDGALNNGYGELDLEAGPQLEPMSQRIRSLGRGYMPSFSYAFDRGGVNYVALVAAQPTGLDPRENLLATVYISMRNNREVPSRATLRAAYNPRGKTARADLPCRPWFQAKFMDAASFKAGNFAEVGNGRAIKNRHVVYMYFPSERVLSPRSTLIPKPDSEHLAVQFDAVLKPGEIQDVVFRVPFVPVSLSRTGEVAKVLGDLLVSGPQGWTSPVRQAQRFWEQLLDQATSISLNDPKVVNTMKSSLIYDLMARDVEADGKHFTQTVNKFQYHDFFMRDTSFIARSYELMNLPDVARTTVEHYLIRDDQGRVTKFRHEAPDDWGQSLWALGSYLRSTDDKGFAKDILPGIKPHLDDFVKQTSTDPLGLWPVAGPYDNELVNGHYTSHNLWALLGLKEAENICRVAGDTEQAERARTLYNRFETNFLKRLDVMTSQAEGYIPPGMDDPKAGFDWENASAGVYPFGVLTPDDVRVTATVNIERQYKYREGIMTWGPNAWVAKLAARDHTPYDPQFLHDYDTFQVTETLLARGEQRKVVEDLYSTLVHTSATNAGFETGIKPWGDRDPGDNYPPHGWFAARYNELVRNMLVREVGNSLHLASALAPKWVEPGQTIIVKRALTNFGLVNYSIKASATGAVVSIDPKWRHAPERMFFHIPWFVSASGAEVDGRPVPIIGREIAFSPAARRVVLHWKWTEHPDLSYERAVRLWLHKAYEPGPREDMDHLFPENHVAR